MTAGAHDADGGLGSAGGANAARGLAVIVAAVLLGFFLMARGIDDSTVASAESSASTTATTAAVDDTAEGSTTITTEPPVEDTTPADTLGARRPPAEVLTLALNGTEPIVAGAAGSMRNLLESNGYAVASPKNADAARSSVILFVEGYESDARGVAELLGADASLVQPFDPANSPIADTQGAQVIVVVGNDGVITS